MNMKLSAAILALLLPIMAHAADPVLPSSCGDEKARFNVSVLKGTPIDEAAPKDRMAKIVFIEVLHKKTWAIIGTPHINARLGVDGSWVGAATQNSGFSVEVPAGRHHLCVSVEQGSYVFMRDLVASTAFVDAEPGKVYYYALDMNLPQYGSNIPLNLGFSTLDETEGPARTKGVDSSTFSPH